MKSKKRLSRLIHIASTVKLMNDIQIEKYLDESGLSIRHIPESRLYAFVSNGISLEKHLVEYDPECWLVNGSEQMIKFFSKRSIVEWHLAKTSGIFDDIYNEVDGAT